MADKLNLNNLAYLAVNNGFVVKQVNQYNGWEYNDKFDYYEVRMEECDDFFAKVYEDEIKYYATRDEYDHEVDPEQLIQLVEFCRSMTR